MATPKASKVFDISFSDGLAIAAIALTIVLLVLDKAGKLRGPILFVLLGVAFAMLIPLSIGNVWVSHAHGAVRVFRAMIGCCAIAMGYSLISLWISTGEAIPEVGSAPSPKQLVSLRQLFENDWPNLAGYYTVGAIEVSSFNDSKVVFTVPIAWRLNGDFVARSKFLAFFLEPKISAADALRACMAIADSYSQFIASSDSRVEIAGQSPDDTSATYLRDMVFSKRIFIYYENPDFSLEQKGSIESLYKSKGLSVQFRDATYSWSHRDDHGPLRHNPLVPNSVLLPDAHLYPGLKITAKNLSQR